jgi:hypothetical protein
MDEAKKYLLEHRDELDVEKPPRPQVWKHIQKQSSVAKKPVIPMMARWLAAACVLALAALLIFRLQGPKGTVGPQVAGQDSTVKNPEQTGQGDSSHGTASVPENRVDSSGFPGVQPLEEIKTPVQLARKTKKEKSAVANAQPLSPLQAVEDNYAAVISYQLKKVSQTPIYAEDAGYFHVFKKQWFDLQKDERKVKQDVRMYGLNDNVVNQLIQLYQQKLWLLKELQSQINKMNIRAKQHPDLQRKNPAYLKL